jgi:hypothetical protein
MILCVDYCCWYHTVRSCTCTGSHTLCTSYNTATASIHTQHGIIPDPTAAARKAEKDNKRAAKRKWNREEQSANVGGSSPVEIVLQDDDRAPVETVRAARAKHVIVIDADDGDANCEVEIVDLRKLT